MSTCMEKPGFWKKTYKFVGPCGWWYIYTRCTVSVWCLWNPASVFEYYRFSFLFSKLISWHVPIDQWQCRSLAIHLGVYLCEEVEIQVTQGLLEVGLPLWIAGVVAGELWPLWLMIRSYRGTNQALNRMSDQMTLEMTPVDESMRVRWRIGCGKELRLNLCGWKWWKCRMQKSHKLDS